jgi:hypothetical protein
VLRVRQVSVERTIGTVCGGVLGLATVLFGHGFGQDGDIIFTGEPHAVSCAPNAFVRMPCLHLPTAVVA